MGRIHFHRGGKRCGLLVTFLKKQFMHGLSREPQRAYANVAAVAVQDFFATHITTLTGEARSLACSATIKTFNLLLSTTEVMSVSSQCEIS